MEEDPALEVTLPHAACEYEVTNAIAKYFTEDNNVVRGDDSAKMDTSSKTLCEEGHSELITP